MIVASVRVRLGVVPAVGYAWAAGGEFGHSTLSSFVYTSARSGSTRTRDPMALACSRLVGLGGPGIELSI